MAKSSTLNPKIVHRFGKGWIFNVTYSPDGSYIAVATSAGIEIYDTVTYERVHVLTNHRDFVASVNFSPDGKLLVSGSDDNTIKIWDSATGKELKTLKGHAEYVTSVRFSPDGNTIVSGSDDDTIKLWDVKTGKNTKTLKGHTNDVTVGAVQPGW